MKDIPIIGDKQKDESICKACHGTGYYWDADGHGGFSWKRVCNYCRKT